jgi:hypothetical protein
MNSDEDAIRKKYEEVDCPECKFPLDDMGNYWYCTSWNCGRVWFTKRPLESVTLDDDTAQKLIDIEERLNSTRANCL